MPVSLTVVCVVMAKTFIH